MWARMWTPDFSQSEFVERRNDLPVELSIWVQYWDEWKGKITDILNQQSWKRISVRFNWAHNAGHSLVVNGKKYAFHMLPSWMLSKWTENLIMSTCVLSIDLNKVDLDKFSMTSQGVICNHSLENLIKRDDKNKAPLRVGMIPEMERLVEGGMDIKESWLKVSGEIPVIWMVNVLLDALDEKTLEYYSPKSRPVWSTWSGISRAYSSDAMRYHLTLNTLLYNEEAFYNALEQYWSKYQHFFPKITTQDLINNAKNERAQIIKYKDNGSIEIIDNEKEYLAAGIEKGWRIIWEWAQSTMIWSSNSYFGSASTPSLESFLMASWLTVEQLANLYLTHKIPTSSVWERPNFAIMPETDVLNWFRKKYEEFWVSSWRPRDIFHPSLPELAQGNSLAYHWIDDMNKVVPVFNRVDGIEDMCKLYSNWLIKVLTWYEFDDGRGNGLRKVGLEWNEIITPDILLQWYPNKSDQLHLFNWVTPEFKKLYTKDTPDTIEKYLGIHLATIFDSDKEREILIWTWPWREDLELMKWSPLRQF